MLQIVIEDNNVLFRTGMELYLRDFFVYLKGMPVEFNELTEESVSQADIIIKSFVAGETALCHPTLNHRKKNSFIVGVHANARSPEPSLLPLCIEDIVYINRSDSLCKIGDILFEGFNRAREGLPLRNCDNCKCVTFTRKQSDILSLVETEASIQEIARKLKISDKKVYANKANLMTRLGIKSTFQLVSLLDALNEKHCLEEKNKANNGR